ncbi:hypothetical protein BDR26DRAFT_927326 [Obelidium mucronatum]|nr:hypothetical protein BDR26DRAFT_927326 [Obelidium mucronatum]
MSKFGPSAHAAERARLRFQEAVANKQFPPVLQTPESNRAVRPAQLFDTPYFVWCPEVWLDGQKPRCQRLSCSCVVNVSEYKTRLVQDVRHTTEVIYVSYECSKLRREDRARREGKDVTDEDDSDKMGRYFNMLCPKFLASLNRPDISKRLPYYFTLKGGFSKHFIDAIVDKGIRSGDGLAQGIKSCQQFRTSRYYELLELFAAACQQMRSAAPDCLIPTPVSVETFLESHQVPDSKTLTNFWLEWTKDYEWVAKLLMETATIKCKMAVDGTEKYAKRLRITLRRKSTDQFGQPVVLKECRIILVIINEIGQVAHACFVKSENHVEIGAAFQSVNDINIKGNGNAALFGGLNLDDDDVEFEAGEADEDEGCATFAGDPANNDRQGPPEVQIPMDLKTELRKEQVTFPPLDSTQEITVCCDNINSYRSVLQRVFGSRVRFTQDPWHFMQRLNTKIKSEYRRNFADELSKLIYSKPRHLWEREIMFYQVRRFLETTPIEYISSTQSEWEGTCLNTLRHIFLGDLSPIASNVYVENGIERSIVETSTCESFNSGLNAILPRRTVSMRVGLRLLMIHIVEVNLEQGQRFGRIPTLNSVPFADLARAAAAINGMIPDSRQTAFALEIMNKRPPANDVWRYSPEGATNLSKWRDLFGLLTPNHRPSQSAIEEATASNSQRLGFRRLFQTSMSHVGTPVILDKAVIVKLLQIEPDSADMQRNWSPEELELLRNVQEEQSVVKHSWSESLLVTAILYNHAVTQNTNGKLNLNSRCHQSIQAKLVFPRNSKPTTRENTLFSFRHPKTTKHHKFTPEEHFLVSKLFYTLSAISMKNRVREFLLLWSFASSTLDNVFCRSEATLRQHWNAKIQQRNREKNSESKPLEEAAGPISTTCLNSGLPDWNPTPELFQIAQFPEMLPSISTAISSNTDTESFVTYLNAPIDTPSSLIEFLPVPLHPRTKPPGPEHAHHSSTTTPTPARDLADVSNSHWNDVLGFIQSRYPDGAQKDWRVVKKHLLTLDPSFQSVTPNALRMKFTRGKSKSQSACQSATVPMATTNVGASAAAVRLPPAAPAAVTGISSLVGIDIVPQIAPGDACVPPIAPKETVDATMTGTAEAVIMPTTAAEPSIPKKRIHHENCNQLSKKRKSEACDSCKRAKGKCDGSRRQCSLFKSQTTTIAQFFQ